MAELLLKRGLHANLANAPRQDGTIYFTTDEGGMYVDVKRADNSIDRVRVQGTVNYYATLNDFIENVQPPYSPDLIYFIEKAVVEGKTTPYNALVRWDDTSKTWIQLNVTKGTYDAFVTEITNRVAITETDIAGLGSRIEAVETWKTGALATQLNDLTSRLGTAEDDIDALEGRMDAAEGAIDVLEAIVSGTDGKSGLVGGLASTQSDLTNLGDKVDGIEKIVGEDANSGLRKAVADLQTDLKGSDGKGGLTKEVADIKGAITNSTTGLSALSAAIGVVDGRVDDVAKDLENVNSTVATEAGKIAALQTWRNDVVTPTLASQGSRIDDLENKVYKANGNLTDKLAGALNRIDALDNEQTGKIASIEGQLDSLNDDLATKVSNEAFQGHVQSYNALLSDVGELSEAHEGTRKDLDDLIGQHAADVEALNGSIAGCVGDISGVSDRVEILEGSASDHETRIGKLEGDVSDHAGRLDDVEDVASAAFDQAATNKSDIAGLRTDLTGVNDNVSNLTGLVKGTLESFTLPQKQNNIVASIIKMDEVLTATTGIATDNAGEITKIKTALGMDGLGDTTNLAGAVANLRTDVDGLSDDLDNLNGTVDGINTNLSNLTTRVDGLEDTLTDKINAANAMRFKGAVNASGFAALESRTDLSSGDTFVVSESFTTGSGNTKVEYHAGDLIVVSGVEDPVTDLITGAKTYTLVQTGYGSAHDVQLKMEKVAGADNTTAHISLTDKLQHNFGEFTIVNSSKNITMNVAAEGITLGLAWDSFDP